MEICVPEVGESIVEALVAKWHRKNGDQVRKEDPVCELETDKVTLEINADAEGILSILVPEGKTVPIGTIIATIRETDMANATQPGLSPAARKLAREKAVRPETVKGSGKKGRILAEDLLNQQDTGERADTPTPAPPKETEPDAASAEAVKQPARPAQVQTEEPPSYLAQKERPVTRKAMTPIRKRIAERLTDARQQTAMVTTFNEVDMGRVIALRRKYKDFFQQHHGVSLGHMPFFVKACVEALKEFPTVNARIDGDDIVYHHFYDISIAVSGDKGLVVPVLRDADQLPFPEIERKISGFVEKVRTNTLTINDLEGGTFTISNGGIFGSLLGTPLINPPQSAILGMHLIQDRPVALLGKVVIRPMMYLALTYDHRIVDGREGVQFLKKVKEFLEEPDEKLLEE
ncbi:MAG: dihydrolipoyllysine-residue succinyltransferase [Geobacteraceae bacterium]|nr:dihydrolipoyllysine-residue succinyltransferase [Geobacteraceae bacterium]